MCSYLISLLAERAIVHEDHWKHCFLNDPKSGMRILISSIWLNVDHGVSILERSLEVKLPTIWTDEKQRWRDSEKKVRRESQRRQDKKKRSSMKRKSEEVSKKRNRRGEVGKFSNVVFFYWFVAPEGQKVGSLKRRVRAIWPDERWEIARRRGAKHVSKSKPTNHTNVGPFLEIERLKKCRLLLHEACFQVKMCKAHPFRTTFEGFLCGR